MTHDRRQFLSRVAAGAALGAFPLAFDAPGVLHAATLLGHADPRRAPDDWDVTWPNRITGRYRTVFDVPEIESGYGVWRAALWTRQYGDILGVEPTAMSVVLVLRHNGVALALNQGYWDRYDLGKEGKVTHPVTQEPTDRNPVLLSSSRGEVPAQFDEAALDRQLARGAVALACDLALQDVIDRVVKKSGAKPDDARREAVAALVPGVILQPSGVFAVMRAQDAGCKYLRAS
ncbi:MAG TPA: hypothetical protein VF041_08865 [Gemmatimonadaceae bacterium]